MRRSRILLLVGLNLVLLLGVLGIFFISGHKAAQTEAPVATGTQGSSLNLILLIAGALVVILLIIGIIISITSRISVEERLGRYTESMDVDEAECESFSPRMSGDSSTDAPPPDKK